MLDLNITLNKIASIALGNGTDPQVIADVESVKAELAATTIAIAKNTSDDDALAQEVATLTTAFSALVDKLAAAPAPVPTDDTGDDTSDTGGDDTTSNGSDTAVS